MIFDSEYAADQHEGEFVEVWGEWQYVASGAAPLSGQWYNEQVFSFLSRDKNWSPDPSTVRTVAGIGWPIFPFFWEGGLS